MQIFDKGNINLMDWEKFQNGAYAKAYLLPLILEGTEKYISNAHCEVRILVFANQIFPLVLGTGKEKDNSYVCSPYAQYISYAKREMEIEFPNNALKRIFSKLILNLISIPCRIGKFEKVLFVNNWLLSTNLYPDFDASEMKELREFLCKNFPKHSIVFRSVNVSLNNEFYKRLTECGFKNILSRQVYIIDQKNPVYKTKKAFKIDKKFSSKLSNHIWHSASEIKPEDYSRMKKLYDDLYLSKYSSINPHFTLDFIRNAMQTGILQFQVLKVKGEIKAVIGFFMRDGVMTNPFVGYDLTEPAEAGLYRLLTLQSIRESERLGLIFNMSSGASEFKRIRGAEPAIEFNMVHTDHLSFFQKLPWKIFHWLSHKVVIPMMKKYGL